MGVQNACQPKLRIQTIMSGGARNRVPGLVDGKSIYGDTTIADTLTSIDETTELTQDELLHSILGELQKGHI